MGDYHGGSTIIRWGRFTSFDPADNGNKSPSRKKRSSSGKAMKAKIKRSEAGRSKAKRVVNPNDKRAATRISMLHSIIDLVVFKGKGFKLPSKLPPDLRDEVVKAGGPRQWAVKQPEYEIIRARKIGKLNGRPLPKKVSRKKVAKSKNGGYKKRSQVRKANPVGDAPVSYILDKIQKAESEKLDIHKIDWDVT